jgi:galactose-1-phosphate uridylyltransferase
MLFIKYSKDKKKAQELMEKDEAFRHVDKDAVEVINICTGAKLPVREEEEVVDMCQAIKDLMEDAAAEAKAEAERAKAEASSAKAEAAKATEEKISVLLKSVKAVMEKTGMTLEQTFSALDISGNDREKLMSSL